MIELADEKTPDRASDLENQQILEKEGNSILAKISDREFVDCLSDWREQQFPSESLVKLLKRYYSQGLFWITFVIGGSLGLSPAVKNDLIYSWVLEN